MQDLSSQVLVLICIYNNYGILERGTGGGPILKLHSVLYMRVPALDIRQLLPITAPIIACLYTMHTLSEINHADFPTHAIACTSCIQPLSRVQYYIGTIQTHTNQNRKMNAQL